MRKARDFRGGNRFATEVEKVGKVMRNDPDGQRYLLVMLMHEDPYVRVWAAKDCLFFEPAKAVPILEELGKMDGVIALSANTTLEEWRAGRLF